MFKLQFTTDNAAFDAALEHHGDRGAEILLRHEIADILTRVADHMRNKANFETGAIRDINGNRIGEWEFKEDAEEVAR